MNKCLLRYFSHIGYLIHQCTHAPFGHIVFMDQRAPTHLCPSSSVKTFWWPARFDRAGRSLGVIHISHTTLSDQLKKDRGNIGKPVSTLGTWAQDRLLWRGIWRPRQHMRLSSSSSTLLEKQVAIYADMNAADLLACTSLMRCISEQNYIFWLICRILNKLSYLHVYRQNMA